MKHIILTALFGALASGSLLAQDTVYFQGQDLTSPVNLAQGTEGETSCHLLCVEGGWILDYWAQESGGNVGDTITFEITAGGHFGIYEGNGITNHYYVYDSITVSAVLADNGINPSTIDGPSLVLPTA